MAESIFDVPLMDEGAQELYLNAMISTPELFANVFHILDAEYFDEQFRKPLGFVMDYYQRNKVIPAKEIIRVASQFTPSVDEVVGPGDVQFMSEQIANFCKFRAVISAVLKAPTLIKENDLGTMVTEITKATQICLDTDLGIDYFDDPLARIMRSSETKNIIKLGLETVDNDVEVSRNEMILICAPSGGGKSVTMANLALNLVQQGLNGVYYSLEMADDKVAKRFDTMISRISGRDIKFNMAEVADAVDLFGKTHKGKLYVKRMRENTTTANDLSAHASDLQRRKGIKLDFIIVDYLDLMKPIEKVNDGNMFTKDKYVAEEVRALAFDFNALVITASQFGRDAWELIRQKKDLGQDHIQGGMSKINTSDLCIGVIKDEAMDDAGEIKFQYLKMRNSGLVGTSRMLTWDKLALRILDRVEGGLELSQNEVIKTAVGFKGKSGLTKPTFGNKLQSSGFKQ